MRISDWSSDVCSSDLIGAADHATPGREQVRTPFGREAGDAVRADHARRQLVTDLGVIPVTFAVAEIVQALDPLELAIFEIAQFVVGPYRVFLRLCRTVPLAREEIGRASCRERVCQYV